MKGWLQISLAGTLLFVATILVLLSVQGRMNHEGTRNIPVLSLLFSAPMTTDRAGVLDDEDAAPARDRAAAKGTTASVDRLEAGAEEVVAAPESQPAAPPPTPLEEMGMLEQFDYLTTDGGLTAAEIEVIARQAREFRVEAERRLATVSEREADLAAREQDLADRDHALRLQIEQLEQERRALDDKIAEFRSLVIAIEQDEYRALLQLGHTLTSLDVASAVKLVVAYWEDTEGGGRDRIVKTLALMDGSAELRHGANKILAALPHERLRELLEERLKVVDLGAAAVSLRGNR